MNRHLVRQTLVALLLLASTIGLLAQTRPTDAQLNAAIAAAFRTLMPWEEMKDVNDTAANAEMRRTGAPAANFEWEWFSASILVRGEYNQSGAYWPVETCSIFQGKIYGAADAASSWRAKVVGHVQLGVKVRFRVTKDDFGGWIAKHVSPPPEFTADSITCKGFRHTDGVGGRSPSSAVAGGGSGRTNSRTGTYAGPPRARPCPYEFQYSVGEFHGSFLEEAGGRWVEKGRDGTYRFVERGRDSHYVYLRDDGRNLNVRLPLGGNTSGVQVGPLNVRGRWGDLYQGIMRLLFC